MNYDLTDPTLLVDADLAHPDQTRYVLNDRGRRMLQVLDALAALDVALDRIPGGRELLAEWQADPDQLLDMFDEAQ